jgi:hypothetical protein
VLRNSIGHTLNDASVSPVVVVNCETLTHVDETASAISSSRQRSQLQRQLSILGPLASIAALLSQHDLSCRIDCPFVRW